MHTQTPAGRRETRRRRIAQESLRQGGVLSLRQLYALGLARWEVRAEERARRWRRWGRQTVRVAEGDEALAGRWRALFEVSPAAVLDGVTALRVAGLRLRDDPGEIHVAVPKSARPRRCRGVVVHETRRYESACVLADPIPRMRPATAAVHAALWARSDRQAALYVLAAAQQGLFTPEEFGAEVAKVRRSRRMKLLRTLHADICGGIETLGEREFARMCRQRGFPEPSRQTWRQTAAGRWRYDVDWNDYGLTVEIDGVQHLDPDVWLRDSLKQNAASLDGRVVLRIPNVALRLDPEPHLDQVEAALRKGGWCGIPRLRPKKWSL